MRRRKVRVCVCLRQKLTRQIMCVIRIMRGAKEEAGRMGCDAMKDGHADQCVGCFQLSEL